MTRLEGVLHDGETSRAHPARMEIHRDRTVVLDVEGAEGVESRLVLEDLDVPARLGDTVRRIRLPGGAVFETPDNDGVDELVRTHRGERPNLIHQLESRLVAVVVATLVMIVAGFAFVTWGIPALAKKAAFAVSPETSAYIGQGTLELLDEVMEPSELLEEDQARLRERFDEIVATAPEGHDFELVFRRGEGFGANAFALPSGTVVMTDELVDLAEHEEEIVAVLAHEVGHVVHRHGLRHVIQSSALAVVIVLVTGDLSSTSGFVAAIPTLLVETSFSRDFEREADEHAARYLVAHGIPTQHFATMLDRLAEQHGGGDAFGGYLSSHPTSDERVQRAQRGSPEEPDVDR